ncbi:MAG: hypothetical protein ACI9YT_000826 [Halobacteriales archaeon]|jgi:hypothetical protein
MDRRRVLNLAVALEFGLLVAPLGLGIGPERTLPVGLFVGNAVIGYAAADSAEDPFVSLSTRPGVWMTVVPPVAYALIFVYGVGIEWERLAWAGLLGAVAYVPAAFVVVLGTDERNRRRLADATVYASFEARPPPRQRRLIVAAGGLLVVSSVTVFGPNVFHAGPFIGGVTAAPLVVAGMTMLWLARHHRRVRVTSAGLAVNRVVHRWSAFGGFAVSEEGITIDGPRSGRTWRFDRDDIQAETDVIDSLSRFLPRTEADELTGAENNAFRDT